MKRLRCRFRTKLAFSSPVTNHSFSMKLTPLESPRQRLLSHQIFLEPECPAPVYTDGFGNQVHSGYLYAPHDRLSFGMEALVEVDETRFDSTFPHPQYRYPTRLTAAGEGILAFWKQHCPEGGTTEELALHLMHALHGAFTYQSCSTTINTTAEEALAQGCGVCQDYAHILLALLRTQRIPCIYVTGLLLGEGQTHAWVEVFTGEKWLPLDPTHDCIAGEHYVALSRGRDFGDSSIDRGVFKSHTFAFQEQTVYAAVEEV